jgi:hypothetical protein
MWLIIQVEAIAVPMAKNPEKKDSVRRAQNKYQLANFKVVGCKLPRETAEAFTKMVEQDPAFIVGNNEKGSVNAALTSFIKAYMESNRGV